MNCSIKRVQCCQMDKPLDTNARQIALSDTVFERKSCQSETAFPHSPASFQGLAKMQLSELVCVPPTVASPPAGRPTILESRLIDLL